MPRGATGGRVLNVRAAAAAGVSNNVCSVRFWRLRQVQGHVALIASALERLRLQCRLLFFHFLSAFLSLL